MQPNPLLIADAWVETGQTSDVLNPWNGQLVGRVCVADRALLDRAIAAAAGVFYRRKIQAPDERAAVLNRVAAGLQAQREAFAQTVVAEAGKPVSMARAEVDRAVITFTAAADEARRMAGETLDAAAFAPGRGHVAVVRRFPVGVVYGMTPFNFPLNLVAHKLAPALACGAPIILKPSPRTPLSTLKLAALVKDCGALPGEVSVVNCPNDLATYLINDPRVRAVSFTGSAAVGDTIKKLAVGKKLTLELGGNAAVIVDDYPDLKQAAAAITAGAFGYAGQSCISVQRVLIQMDQYETMRELLVEQARAVLTGDPSDEATINGPMIDRAAQQRVLSSIESAVAAGAKVLIGGGAVRGSDAPCVMPAILEDVPPDHPLWAEEAFGPVMVLKDYNEFIDALSWANLSRYGLQAGVYTRNLDQMTQAFDMLEVGGVMINQPPTFRLDNLPYGGVKDSGVGREGPRWAIEEMTEPRVMILRQ